MVLNSWRRLGTCAGLSGNNLWRPLQKLTSCPQSGEKNVLSNKSSKRGSPYLRKALFNVMACYLQKAPADEPVLQFLDRKRTEGKPYYVYMTAGPTSSSVVTSARSWSAFPLWRICRRRWIWTPPGCKNLNKFFLFFQADAGRQPFCVAHFYPASLCKIFFCQVLLRA